VEHPYTTHCLWCMHLYFFWFFLNPLKHKVILIYQLLRPTPGNNPS
jgi:hypothetical protein